MNPQENFYNGLNHDAWREFEEELRYRLEIMQNEAADIEWVHLCAMCELVQYAREAVAKEIVELNTKQANEYD